MANIKSSKKDIRRIEKRTAKNRKIKNKVVVARRALNDQMSDTNDNSKLSTAVSLYNKALGKAAKEGVLHKNAVARRMSNVAKKLNNKESN